MDVGGLSKHTKLVPGIFAGGVGKQEAAHTADVAKMHLHFLNLMLVCLASQMQITPQTPPAVETPASEVQQQSTISIP
jgi:hypothetical protein